jgi:hypothetical protein
MTELEYRQAVPEDAALLARMNQHLIRDEGHRNSISLVQLEERMSTWLRNEYKAFIFLKTQEPVGYVLFRPEADWLYVRQLFVSSGAKAWPERRLHGFVPTSGEWSSD